METRTSCRPSVLSVLVLALVGSRLSAPALGDGIQPKAQRVWHGEIEQMAKGGFVPASCVSPMAAPELLALADWPLDADGLTCGAGAAASGTARDRVAIIEDVVAHPPVVPVVAGPVALQGAAIDAPLTLAATVAEDELEGLRGGFELPGGLSMSFGLERLVYINGVLQSTTRLTVTELGELLAGGLSARAAVQAGQSPGAAQGAQAASSAQAQQPVNPPQAAQAAHTAQSVQAALPVQASGPAVVSSSSAPASLPLEVGTTLAVIQSGTGNTFAADIPSAAVLGNFIQNSLHDQRIQIVTTVNASVNSMELLRAEGLRESIRSSMNLR